MKIAVGFDHAGFPLKHIVLEAVRDAGHEPIDMGTNSADPVDFPELPKKLGELSKGAKPNAEFWSAVLGLAPVLPRIK